MKIFKCFSTYHKVMYVVANDYAQAEETIKIQDWASGHSIKVLECLGDCLIPSKRGKDENNSSGR